MILLILTIAVMPTSSGNVASDGMIVFENINIIPADIPLNIIDVNIAYSFQLHMILEEKADVATVAVAVDDEDNSAVVVSIVLSIPVVPVGTVEIELYSEEDITRVKGIIGGIMELLVVGRRRCY